MRTLVASFQVADDGTVYVLPMAGVQAHVLLCYQGGAFSRTIHYSGGVSEFLVLPDSTIYSMSSQPTAADGAVFFITSPDGKTETLGGVRGSIIYRNLAPTLHLESGSRGQVVLDEAAGRLLQF